MKRSSSIRRLVHILTLAGITCGPSCAVSAQTAACTGCVSAAVDWTSLPSTFTHREGVQVDQFASAVQPTTYADELRSTSVYRHHRSSLQGGNSTDHYHRVDEYGGNVRPYGEWRYPYRPYSVPYQGWGPQLPQVYSNFQSPNFRGNNFGPIGQGQNRQLQDPQVLNPNAGFYNGNFGGPAGGTVLPGPQNALSPLQDEFYPDAPEPRPMSDRDFFYSPIRP